MADRILLRGGHVLTVDPVLGDIAGGDVLIEGDTIALVGTDISADAQVIDCTGNIVIPGFVAIRKRDGKLTGDWDSARKKVETSSAYLLDALAKKQQESSGS